MPRRSALPVFFLGALSFFPSLPALAESGAQDSAPLAAYVLIGDGGQALARAIVAGDACPALWIDGVAGPMRTRVAPGTPSARPGQGKSAAFPVRVCEAPVPASVQALRIAGRALPLPKAQPQRIVVIGDTGCRIKAGEHAFQDCADTKAWPFAAVAAAAVAEHPDLVLHVGDYHYRESPCPGDLGCAASPWGYGWDAWYADFFQPAAPLLQAAPWILARGNHEECARAGQGWFRTLDSQGYEAARSCDRAEDDAQGNFSAPYAVPLGGGWQIVVFDSARASKPLNPATPADVLALEQYERELRAVASLAAVPGMQTIFVSHHPILGYAPRRSGGPAFGNAALLEAMREAGGGRYYPDGVVAAVHGHVHAFQAIDFSSGQPATIVAGHGGDNLDSDLPDELPARYAEAPGVVLDFAAHASRFGYLVMDRTANGWQLRAQALDGATLAACALTGKHLACAGTDRISRPPVVPAP